MFNLGTLLFHLYTDFIETNIIEWNYCQWLLIVVWEVNMVQLFVTLMIVASWFLMIFSFYMFYGPR